MQTTDQTDPAEQADYAERAEQAELESLRTQVGELQAANRNMLNGYSAALDEVFRLRQLCAYEALGHRASLDYATFPKSRRRVAQDSVTRLQRAARGESASVTAPLSWQVLRHALREAAAPEGLTRSSFEETLPTRTRAEASDR